MCFKSTTKAKENGISNFFDNCGYRLQHMVYIFNVINVLTSTHSNIHSLQSLNQLYYKDGLHHV